MIEVTSIDVLVHTLKIMRSHTTTSLLKSDFFSKINLFFHLSCQQSLSSTAD